MNIKAYVEEKALELKDLMDLSGSEDACIKLTYKGRGKFENEMIDLIIRVRPILPCDEES